MTLLLFPLAVIAKTCILAGFGWLVVSFPYIVLSLFIVLTVLAAGRELVRLKREGNLTDNAEG